MLYNLKLPDYSSRILSRLGEPLTLNAAIDSAGRERRNDTSYSWHGQKRGQKNFAFWQFTLSGRGNLDYEGKQYSLHPGDAMLLHVPHHHHYYLPPDSSHWEFIFINLSGIECLRLCREIEAQNGPILHYDNAAPSLKLAEHILEAVIILRETDHLKLSALAYQFCMTLAGDVIASGGFNSRPPAIEAAVRFAIANFEQPIGVDEMSNAAGLSRYYFTRLFQRHMSTTPGEFIHQLRLEKATRLLQAKYLGLAEIAAESGFQSTSYFCRAFRLAYGTTPGEFREGQILQTAQAQSDQHMVAAYKPGL